MVSFKLYLGTASEKSNLLIFDYTTGKPTLNRPKQITKSSTVSSTINGKYYDISTISGT